MIYCPKCGTSNRKGSRFCSECGDPLPSTGTRCPMCGTTNPVSNVYCMECTARLVPMTSVPDAGEDEGEPIQGISLPTIPLDEGEQDEELEVTAETGSADEDWLDELRESADEEVEEHTREIEANGSREEAEDDLERADIPDWLQEMGPISQESDVSPSTNAFSLDADPDEDTPSEDELPDERPVGLWDVSEPEQASVAAEEEPADTDISVHQEDRESLAPAEIPEWLGELGDGGDDRLESVGDSEWLEEIEKEAEDAPSEAPGTPLREGIAETFELPEWVRTLMNRSPAEEDAPQFGVETPLGGDSSGELEHGDVPDWLRQLKAESHDRGEAPDEPLETEGVLQGLRGIITPATELEAPAAYEIRSAAATSEVSRARARLLESLLGEQTVKPKPSAKERTGLGELAERGIVAIVLLVTVLSMLLAPMITGKAVRLTGPVESSEAERLHGIVEALDATDNVLIAFDYGVPATDELDQVARPVLEHLVESGADISIVSTRPDGLPVAGALMSEVTDSRDDYTLLGYRPGGGTAVSQLLAGEETLPSVLLVVTGRPGSLVRWVEQAEARYGSDVPVAAVGSALLEPVIQPYVDANAGQIEAAIHGLRGAASYEAAREATGRATEHLDTLAAGHIAIVALLLVGAGVYGLGGAGRRR